MRIERGVNTSGLSGLSLLICIHRRGPATASRLAQEEGLKPQSLTRLLAGLEKRGLVSRQVDGADRRRVLIQITTAGRRALAADMGRLWDWLDRGMTECLAPDELDTLARSAELLERLAAWQGS